MISPIATLRNNGQNDLTSLEIHYKVNDSEEGVLNWAGDLVMGEIENVPLPLINFTLNDQNTLLTYCANPNNVPDECPDNDAASSEFSGEALVAASTVYLTYRLDNFPEQTSWELRDQTGAVLYADGPFPGQPGLFAKDTFQLAGNQCYDFIIYDTQGNGICCETGIGFYMVKDSDGNFLVEQGGDFGYSEVISFEVAGNVGIADKSAGASVHLFPNPAHDRANIEITLMESVPLTLEIHTLTGEMVKSIDRGMLGPGEHQIIINLCGMVPGVYFIQVSAGAALWTRKLFVLD
jgi:hypothetical protein